MRVSLPKLAQKLVDEPEEWLRSECRAAKNERAIKPVLQRFRYAYQTWEPVQTYMLRACLVNVDSSWAPEHVAKKYHTNRDIRSCVDEIVSVADVPLSDGQDVSRGKKRKREHANLVGKALADGRNVGVWLSEVRFFLEDVYGDPRKGMSHLLAICFGSFAGDESHLVRGDENLDTTSRVIDCMMKKAHFETLGSNNLAVVVTGVTATEFEILERLENLTFHCRGHIHLFDLRPSKDVFGSYVAHMKNHIYGSNFFFLEDLAPIAAYDDPMLLAHAVGLILFFVTPKGQMRLWLVFDSRQKRKEWVCIGGRVCIRTDGSVEEAIRREWEEEMPGHSWDDSIDGPTNEPIHNEATGLRIDGVEYACQPVFLAKATQSFYEATSRSAEYRMPLPSTGYVRMGECPRCHHTDGWPYIEKEIGAWFELDLDPPFVRLWRPGRKRDRICPRDTRMLKRVCHILDYHRRMHW